MRGFAFPGQGSQYVGMGKVLYEKHGFIRDLYDYADRISGKPIKELSFFGPETELVKTENTQPAIFVYSAALLELVKRDGISYDVVFGHSLGEFTALYAAGVFTFEETLKLVVKRGELMGRAKGGKMAAVIGQNAYDISEKVLSEVGVEKTVIANINSPLQVVISGEENEVDKVISVLKERYNTLRVIPLKVSTAFHSPLMDGAAREFAEVLGSAHFSEPKVPVIMNSTGKVARNSREIYEALRVQLRSSVRFIDMINTALDMGVDEVWEIGPKKVLCGLISQITDRIKTASAEEMYAQG
ncbi:MAG: ACP S-malonyltransferase [candidate division WOR-3 bacterium]